MVCARKVLWGVQQKAPLGSGAGAVTMCRFLCIQGSHRKLRSRME